MGVVGGDEPFLVDRLEVGGIRDAGARARLVPAGAPVVEIGTANGRPLGVETPHADAAGLERRRHGLEKGAQPRVEGRGTARLLLCQRGQRAAQLGEAAGRIGPSGVGAHFRILDRQDGTAVRFATESDCWAG